MLAKAMGEANRLGATRCDSRCFDSADCQGRAYPACGRCLRRCVPRHGRPSRECSGRLARVARLATLLQPVFHCADCAQWLAHPNGKARTRLLDRERKILFFARLEYTEKDQSHPVDSSVARRSMGRQRRHFRRASVRHRSVDANRSTELGVRPERLVCRSAIRLARLADGRRLAQLQRSPSDCVFHHRLCRSASRGNHRVPIFDLVARQKLGPVTTVSHRMGSRSALPRHDLLRRLYRGSRVPRLFHRCSKKSEPHVHSARFR